MMGDKMLKIDKKNNAGKLELKLIGKLDTTTAPELEEAISSDLKEGVAVTIDMAELAYISSAGLRVLLMVKKSVGNGGTLKLRNVTSEVQDVLEITGFSTLLEQE